MIMVTEASDHVFFVFLLSVIFQHNFEFAINLLTVVYYAQHTCMLFVLIFIFSLYVHMIMVTEASDLAMEHVV